MRSELIPSHLRFGSKADMTACLDDVRFTPKSGHRNSLAGCLLCAKSRHYDAELVRCAFAISGRRAADSQTEQPPAPWSTSRGEPAGRNEASPCSDRGRAGRCLDLTETIRSSFWFALSESLSGQPLASTFAVDS